MVSIFSVALRKNIDLSKKPVRHDAHVSHADAASDRGAFTISWQLDPYFVFRGPLSMSILSSSLKICMCNIFQQYLGVIPAREIVLGAPVLSLYRCA